MNLTAGRLEVEVATHKAVESILIGKPLLLTVSVEALHARHRCFVAAGLRKVLITNFGLCLKGVSVAPSRGFLSFSWQLSHSFRSYAQVFRLSVQQLLKPNVFIHDSPRGEFYRRRKENSRFMRSVNLLFWLFRCLQPYFDLLLQSSFKWSLFGFLPALLLYNLDQPLDRQRPSVTLRPRIH